MMRRLLLALLVALSLLLVPTSRTTADGGQVLASLIASATGITRTYDATLAGVAAVRVHEIVTDGHRPLTELTSAGWYYGEVIGWNRGYADPFAAVVAAWMESPGHEPILRDAFYTRIGCDHLLLDGTHWFVCIVGMPTRLPAPPVPAPPIIPEIPDTAMEGGSAGDE